MPTYLERYQRGEREHVWAELVAHGATIRNDPLHYDAHAVAVAMMERARQNVALLVQRLPKLGYRFAYPDQVWIPTNAAIHQLLDEMEFNYGLLPLAVRTWFDVVGSVNLMGAHPKLSSYAELDWKGSRHIDGDPLVVMTELLGEGDILNYNGFYKAAIAPDTGHKAGESSNGTINVLLPNPAFDAPLLDDGGRWTGTFFIHHIQTCFEWGGFPGLRGGWEPGQQSDPTFSKAELDFLTKDLLPLL